MQWASEGQNLKANWAKAKLDLRGQLRPKPWSIGLRPRQKLRPAVAYVWQPDRIGSELNVDCFCLDINLKITAVVRVVRKIILHTVTFDFTSAAMSGLGIPRNVNAALGAKAKAVGLGRRSRGQGLHGLEDYITVICYTCICHIINKGYRLQK